MDAKQPPEEAVLNQTFDEAAAATMQQAAQNVLAAHPEVRSVVVAFDYRGAFASIVAKRVIWIGADGTVIEPAAIFGSLQSTILACQHILQRAGMMEESFREVIKEQLNEIANNKRELNAAAAARIASEQPADQAAGTESQEFEIGEKCTHCHQQPVRIIVRDRQIICKNCERTLEIC